MRLSDIVLPCSVSVDWKGGICPGSLLNALDFDKRATLENVCVQNAKEKRRTRARAGECRFGKLQTLLAFAALML